MMSVLQCLQVHGQHETNQVREFVEIRIIPGRSIGFVYFPELEQVLKGTNICSILNQVLVARAGVGIEMLFSMAVL